MIEQQLEDLELVMICDGGDEDFPDTVDPDRENDSEERG